MWTREGEKNGIKKNSTNKSPTRPYVPRTASDMDPGEPVNMSTFDVFELTHAAPHSVYWKELA